MMKPRLILHVGTHKTGTTAFQKFCSMNRAELGNRGIYYPTMPDTLAGGGDQHHHWAHAFANKSRKLDSLGAVNLTREWADRAAHSQQVTLISAEPIYRHVLAGDAKDETWQEQRLRYLQALKNALDPFQVEIVVLFRQPASYIRSLYLENLTTSLRPIRRNFKKYIRVNLEGNLRYGDNALMLKEVFGDVTCFEYEKFKATNIFHSFFYAFGVDVSDLPTPGLVRKSLRPAEAMIVNTIKIVAKQQDIDLKGSRPADIFESIKERQPISGYLGRNLQNDLWSDNDQILMLNENCAGQVQILEQEFFKRSTGLLVPPKGDVSPEIEMPPLEVTEQILNALHDLQTIE